MIRLYIGNMHSYCQYFFQEQYDWTLFLCKQNSLHLKQWKCLIFYLYLLTSTWGEKLKTTFLDFPNLQNIFTWIFLTSLNHDQNTSTKRVPTSVAVHLNTFTAHQIVYDFKRQLTTAFLIACRICFACVTATSIEPPAFDHDSDIVSFRPNARFGDSAQSHLIDWNLFFVTYFCQHFSTCSTF